jgi:coenzyme F420-0:L-glutamate ligase/coenzyme F420-1:gamma-L-glutamate ligase
MPRTTFTKEELDLLSRTRVARLATADSTGQPHVIPIVFATDDERLYTPLDKKPKRLAPNQLKRVRNLIENPKLAFVVDHYEEDWTKLAWVMVKGTGSMVESGEEYATGVRLLEQKYPQYVQMPLKDRPLIVITPLEITNWDARL